MGVGDVFIPISEKDYEELVRPWASALICKVIGKSLSKEFIKEEILKLWRPQTPITMSSVGKGYYIISGVSEEEKERILVEGPWFILRHHLSTTKWKPGFQPSNAKSEKAPIWVNLPELPLEFYSKKVLEQIENSMGEVLKID